MNVKAMIPAFIAFVSVQASQSLQDFRLPNGLRVVLAENHERPLVRLELRAPWDPAEEPLGKEGMGGFLGEMLKQSGAGSYKQEAFQRFLEDHAVRFSFSMQAKCFAWSVLSDSQGQDVAFESLSLAATRPDLDPAQVEARRQRFIQTFKERTSRQRAEDRFLRSIGVPENRMFPQESSVSRFDASDLSVLLRRLVRPERAVLVVQGDVNLPQVRQLAMLHLGAWGPGIQEPVPPLREKIQEQTRKTRIWLVREAGMAVEIRAGAPAPTGDAIPAFPRDICHWLIRRELTLALPTALDKIELQTFPDGAWELTARAVPGKTAPEALRAIQQLLGQLRGNRIGDREMAAAREALRTERISRALHPQQEAEALAERVLLGGGLEEPSHSLKIEEIQPLLQRMFKSEDMFYFVVGAVPEDAVRLGKEGLGPVELVN